MNYFQHRHAHPFTVASGRIAIGDIHKGSTDTLGKCKKGDWMLDVTYMLPQPTVSIGRLMVRHSSIAPEHVAGLTKEILQPECWEHRSPSKIAVCDSGIFRGCNADGAMWRNHCLSVIQRNRTHSGIVYGGAVAEIDRSFLIRTGLNESSEIVAVLLESDYIDYRKLVPHFDKRELLRLLTPVLKGTGMQVKTFLLDGHDDFEELGKGGYMVLSVPYQGAYLKVPAVGMTKTSVLYNIISAINAEIWDKMPLLDHSTLPEMDDE